MNLEQPGSEKSPIEKLLPGYCDSVDESISQASNQVQTVLRRALNDEELNFDEGCVLAAADGNDLAALVCVANELRKRQVGDHITYVVNRNINFTNVCMVGCAFCGFARGPHADDAYSLTTEQIVAKASEAWDLGATEVCIQGGLPKKFHGLFYRDILRAIKAALPKMHIHAFSPMEISYGCEKTGMAAREYLAMMKENGLDTIPGTAAEILDDEVRSALSPNKLKVAQWIEIVKTAHRLGIRSTSTMMYGHVETIEHWVRHMLLLRDIQKETGGFTEFVPLGFIHEKTRLFQREGARPGSTIRENLAVHAVARVLFNGLIRNIQVSWVKMGFEQSLACLQVGANDFSGTLMEEHISKSAGANFGESVSPAKLRALIRSIGRIPAERTTTYGLRRVYGEQADEGESQETWTAQGNGSALHVMDAHQPASGLGY